MADFRSAKIYRGDARLLAAIDSNTVHLVVTSPPYWQLKDYGHDDQIGFHQSFPQYIDDLNLVWQECLRVLHPGCRLCINVGDQFARAAYYGRYKVLSIQSEIIRFVEASGADYLGTIIWQKVTSTRTSGGASIMGSFPFPRNGMVKFDYEYILLFKKFGAAPKPTASQREAARLTTEEWNQFFTGHWQFPGARQADHLAAFPEELPARLIRMFSFPGETVLDPFCGSGTTLAAAHRWGRRGIGYELVPEYARLAQSRLKENGIEATIRECSNDLDLERARNDLPYRIEGRKGPSLRIDPRSRTFGSRISRNAK